MSRNQRMSWPNRITVGRILLIVPFVIAMLHVNEPVESGRAAWPRYWALLIFLVMALSDAADGWLARRSQSVTALGTFLDPLADKLLSTSACLLLAAPATAIEGMVLPKTVVVIIIGKDLYTALGFLIVYLVTQEMKILPAAAGKLNTLLQLSMVLGILIGPDASPHFAGFGLIVACLWWSAAGVAVVTMIIYTRRGTQYLNEHEQRQKTA